MSAAPTHTGSGSSVRAWEFVPLNDYTHLSEIHLDVKPIFFDLKSYWFQLAYSRQTARVLNERAVGENRAAPGLEAILGVDTYPDGVVAYRP